jgi:hypothetical protein
MPDQTRPVKQSPFEPRIYGIAGLSAISSGRHAMKILFSLCAIVAALAMMMPAPVSAHRHTCHFEDGGDSLFRDGGVQIDLDDGSLIFTHEDDDETVEITDTYELIVNGRPVRLNRDQQRLVKEYRDSFEYIVEEAKEIGIEGARVGVQGAKLGVAAALGVLKLLSPDYDSDDLDRDLDRKGRKVDRLASRLEKRADRLERKVDRFEDLHDRLRNEIDELDELGWF